MIANNLTLNFGDRSLAQIEAAISGNRINVNGFSLNAVIEQLIEDWRTLHAEVARLKKPREDA
jgi:outer membrane murein-binding lipoprotein Lpp